MRFALVSLLLCLLYLVSFIRGEQGLGVEQVKDAVCDACCAQSGSDNDAQTACVKTKEVNGIVISSVIKCCGVINNNAFCCPDDESTQCKFHNVPFFQKYTCTPSRRPLSANKVEAVKMVTMDESTPAESAPSEAQLDANGNNNSSSSSTLAWWIWFLISIAILLFVICVVISIFKCVLGVACSIL